MNVKKKLAMLLCGTLMAAATTSVAGAAEEPEEIEKVVMGFLPMFVPSAEGEAAVEEAINAITRDSIGVEVDLLILDGVGYSQQATLMLSGNEQLDIFNCITLGFSSVINNGYTLDLEEDDLLQTYGQGIIEEMGDLIEGCRFNGQLYGLPQNFDYGSIQNGFIILQECLDEIGYEYEKEAVNKITWEELEDIFARLHEAFPERNVYIPQENVLVSGHVYCDNLGGDGFGVLMQPDSSLEVSNLFTSPEYIEACKRVYNWNQKGYISGDAMTSGQTLLQAIAADAAMAYSCNIHASVLPQQTAQHNRPVAAFQIGENALIKSSEPSSKAWCINANTDHPVAAMKLLNAFYTVPELADLLIYGIEGVDYVVSEDGHYTFPEGTDGKVGYHPDIAWLMPNEFISGVWEGNDLDIWEKTRAFRDAASVSAAMGFMFDNSEYTTEYTALTNIYREYQNQIEFGFVDPETAIPEMEKRMNAAGLEDYMAAKQEQLDAWAAEK